MPSNDLDSYIAEAARVLAIDVAPEWHAAVRANLETTLRLARLVETFDLPDEAEPAFVFKA